MSVLRFPKELRVLQIAEDKHKEMMGKHYHRRVCICSVFSLYDTLPFCTQMPQHHVQVVMTDSMDKPKFISHYQDKRLVEDYENGLYD